MWAGVGRPFQRTGALLQVILTSGFSCLAVSCIRLVCCLEVAFFRPINETLPVVLPLGGGSKEGDVKKKVCKVEPSSSSVKL